MTGTEVDVETQAHQIAARGREALVERMRTAYGDAAAAHADVISLDDEQIEAMVQSAADRADGLQWRRALAAVAAEELGISATEALSLPAVLRAQALVGAPSYEQSLAELIARPVPPPAPATTSVTPITANDASPGGVVPEPEPTPEPASEPPAAEPPAAEPPAAEPPAAEPPAAPKQESDSGGDELETVEADDVVLELLPEPDPIEYETEVYDVAASFVDAGEQGPPTPEPFVPAPEASAAAEEPLAAAPEPLAAAPEPLAAAPEPFAAAAEEQPPLPSNPFSAKQTEPLAEEPPAGEEDEQESASAQEHEQESAPLQEEEIEVGFAAVHLGGVANLPTKREGLSVRLSSDGLDIMQGPRNIIGRLVWDEIEALEVPNLRVRRRQKQARARLVVRTPHGDASFEVPDVPAEELRDRVEPLMRLYGRH
jgi:hypothetical protein